MHVAAVLWFGLAGCPRAPLAPDPQGSFAYRRGVHVNHWLNFLVPGYEGHSGIDHTYAAPWFDAEDLDWIGAHGFDHVQIHVEAGLWISEAGELLDDKVAPFAQILDAANRRGLGVVLLLDGTPGSPGGEALDPEDRSAVAARTSGWERIAARFAEVGPGLRFRVEEDATTPSAPERLGGYLEAIRASSPERFVYLPVPASEDEGGGPMFVLGPLSEEGYDDAVGLAFSSYWPEIFSVQLRTQPVSVPFPGEVPDFGDLDAPDSGYAEWYLPLARRTEAGSALRIEDLEARIAQVAAWAESEAAGRELYLGAFGLNEGIDPEASARYLSTLVGSAEREGIGWSVYDYESGRAVRGDDGLPTPIYEGLGLDRQR